MYTVYADSTCLYNPTIADLAIYNTKVDLELNKSGSFSFSISPTNPYINSIVKLKTVITVYEDKDVIFRGRVLDDQENFNKAVTIKCEGELAFLNDSTQRPFEFTGTPAELFTYLITKHNEQVDEFKQFKIGQITVTDPNNYINRSDTEYSKTLDLIKEQLIDSLGGYIWFRHETDGVYIDYLKDFTTLNRQPVRFASNLLDLTKYEKAKDMATVIIPLGATIEDENNENKGERLTIKSVNNGLDYIEDLEAIALRGRIVKVVKFDDVTDPANLKRKGQESLSQSVLLTNSIELDAVDLSSINKDFSNFKIGSYVLIESAPHDLDTTMLVSKLSINLQKSSSNKLTLGSTSTSFTDKQHDVNNKYDNVVETVVNIKKNYEVNIPKIESDIEEIKNRKQYRLQVVSSHGNIFKNGDISTTLSAVLYEWDQVVTDNYNDNQFIWSRVSNDSDADLVWNQVHASGQKSIQITSEDVQTRATFFCDFIDPVTRKSLL